jgi:hypothetical protein
MYYGYAGQEKIRVSGGIELNGTIFITLLRMIHDLKLMN